MFNEWYLARNTHSTAVLCYPSSLTGITKHDGCVFYRPTHGMGYTTTWGMILSYRNCRKIFGHCPKSEGLICVKKTRKGWKSEKIDLEFS